MKDLKVLHHILIRIDQFNTDGHIGLRLIMHILVILRYQADIKNPGIGNIFHFLTQPGSRFFKIVDKLPVSVL